MVVLRWFYLHAASRGDRELTSNLCSVSPEGGLAIAYMLYLVNYVLISSLQLVTLMELGSCLAHPVTAASAKYCAIF